MFLCADVYVLVFYFLNIMFGYNITDDETCAILGSFELTNGALK